MSNLILDIDPDTVDRLRRYCDESGITMAAVVDMILRHFLDHLPVTIRKGGE